MTVQLTLGGTTGTRYLLVVIPSGDYVVTGTPVYFTVTAPPSPSISTLSPVSGPAGKSVSFTLKGANFAAGSTVSLSGSGVSVLSTTVVNSSRITVQVALPRRPRWVEEPLPWPTRTVPATPWPLP